MATPQLTPEQQIEFDRQIKISEDALQAVLDEIENKYGVKPYKAEKTARDAKQEFIREQTKNVPLDERDVAKKSAEQQYKAIVTAPRTPSGEVAPITGQTLTEGFFGKSTYDPLLLNILKEQEKLTDKEIDILKPYFDLNKEIDEKTKKEIESKLGKPLSEDSLALFPDIKVPTTTREMVTAEVEQQQEKGAKILEKNISQDEIDIVKPFFGLEMNDKQILDLENKLAEYRIESGAPADTVVKLNKDLLDKIKSIKIKKYEDLTLGEAIAISSILPADQRQGIGGILASVLPQRIRTEKEEKQWREELAKDPNLLANLKWLTNLALTYTDPNTGEIVENTPGWVLRLLSVPISAFVGALESDVRWLGRKVQEARGIGSYEKEDVVRQKSWDQAMAERIASGGGLMEAGVDVGSHASFETGGLAVPLFGPSIAGANFSYQLVTGDKLFDKEALRWLGGTVGGFTGLAGDFALPISVVPVSAVSAPTKAATAVSKTATAAGATKVAKAAEKVAEITKPLAQLDPAFARGAQGAKTEAIKAVATKVEQEVSPTDLRRIDRKLSESDVPFAARDTDFYRNVAEDVLSDISTDILKTRSIANLDQLASLAKDLDDFSKPRRFVVQTAKGSQLKELDNPQQFYNYVARKRIDGNTGLWNILVAPDENLTQVGNIGFLPKYRMADYQKVARPIFRQIRKSIDDKLEEIRTTSRVVTSAEISEAIIKDVNRLILKDKLTQGELGRYFSGILSKGILTQINQQMARANLVDDVGNLKPESINQFFNVFADVIASQFDEYQNIFDLNKRFQAIKDIERLPTRPSVRGLTSEIINYVKTRKALINISDSAFQPAAISTGISRFTRTLSPSTALPIDSPMNTLFKNRLSNEWANLSQRLRREFNDEFLRLRDDPEITADPNTKGIPRVLAFEKTLLPQTRIDTSTYVDDLVATLLGRVEIIEEVLSSSGVSTSSAIFNNAKKLAKEFIATNPEIIKIKKYDNLTINDVNEILNIVKQAFPENVTATADDLINLIVYKKMYTMQSESLINTFRKLGTENPLEFPYVQAQEEIKNILSQVTSARAKPTRKVTGSYFDERTARNVPIIEEVKAADVPPGFFEDADRIISERILNAFISNDPDVRIPKEFRKFYSKELINQILSETSSNDGIQKLIKYLPETNAREIMSEALRLVDDPVFLPMVGERIEFLSNTNPAYRQLFRDLKIPANIEGAQQVVRTLRDNKKNIPLNLNALSKIIIDFTDTIFGLGTFAKGALLSGKFLPNLKFFAVNHLTAPLIISGTLGSRYGFASLRELVFANPKVEAILSTLSAPEFFNPGAYKIFKIDINDVAAKTPTRTYTYGELREIIERTGISRSQARAELSKQVIKDFVNRSRIQLKEIAEESGVKVTQQNDFKRFIKRWIFDNENIWADLSNMSDNRYRIGVLIRALESGESEAAAIKIAKESLFDYGNLLEVEKNIINKIIWFWTFRRNNYLNVIKNFFSNPARLKNQYLARKYLDQDRENSVPNKDYARARAGRWMFKETKQLEQYGLYGPSIPLLEGYYELADAIALIPLLSSSANGQPLEQILNMLPNTAQYAISQTNPLFKAVFTLAGFDLDSQREDKSLGNYVDPKLAIYFQQTGTWEIAKWFLEPVDYDKERNKKRTTFYGQQWKVKEGKEWQWQSLLNIMLTIGVKRMLTEYAPLMALTRQKDLERIPLIDEETGEQFIDEEIGEPIFMNKPGVKREQEVTGPELRPTILTGLGVLSVIKEPSLDVQKEKIKEQIYRDIKNR